LKINLLETYAISAILNIFYQKNIRKNKVQKKEQKLTLLTQIIVLLVANFLVIKKNTISLIKYQDLFRLQQIFKGINKIRLN